MGRSYAEHSFYCLSCGNKGIPLSRPQGFKHERMHRKKLYCIHCKQEVNHIECKTFDEIEEFKENFINGVYKNESEESCLFTQRTSWLRQEYIRA